MSKEDSLLVTSLYRFIEVVDPPALRQRIYDAGVERGLKGTILVAPEGINGTIVGIEEEVERFLSYLETEEGITDIPIRESRCKEFPFQRWKVRLKKEIVTLGVEGVSPTKQVGKYLEPDEWNEMLKGGDVTVVDTRNHYETRIGKFAHAVDPATENFRDFPRWVETHLDPNMSPKVAMYCTGGIRCEKATSLLLQKGFKEVYHLKGGILRYLEETPSEESLWEGDCFVFDDRVSVDPNLEQGAYTICEGCQLPVLRTELDQCNCQELKRPSKSINQTVL
ncbi:MAG: rhodanese-related sulfurtransferase [Verrucomicrobiota bacterium]